MATSHIKIKKARLYNTQKKQTGFIARVVKNGTESLESVAAEAARNTTINRYELAAAMCIATEQLALALKNGYAVDLGPLGRIYPTVSGPWVATADELSKADLKVGVRFEPGSDIRETLAGAVLSWDKSADDGGR